MSLTIFPSVLPSHLPNPTFEASGDLSCMVTTSTRDGQVSLETLPWEHDRKAPQMFSGLGIDLDFHISKEQAWYCGSVDGVFTQNAQGPGFSPQYHICQTQCHRPINPALRKGQQQEHQRFKVLSVIVSSRLACVKFPAPTKRVFLIFFLHTSAKPNLQCSLKLYCVAN